MDNIINKTYVINLKRRSDRWNNITNAFKNTNLNLIRWNAVDGSLLSDEELKSHTNFIGNNICSKSMVGCYLSHYNLWKHIYKNKETNVLILEDDCYPTKNFKNDLIKTFKYVPTNYDLIYLSINRISQYSLINDKKYYAPNLYIPNGMFSGSQSYIISYRGVEKLINSNLFKKAIYHIDIILRMFYEINNEFKKFYIYPHLIIINENISKSDNMNKNDEILNKILSKIKLNKYIDSKLILNSTTISNYKLNITITIYMIIKLFIYIILGYVLPDIKLINYNEIMRFIIKLPYNVITDKNSILQKIFELSLFYIGTNLGNKLKNHK